MPHGKTGIALLPVYEEIPSMKDELEIEQVGEFLDQRRFFLSRQEG